MKFKMKNIIFKINTIENCQGLAHLKEELKAEGVVVVDHWQKQTFAFNHVAVDRTLYLMEETLFVTDDMVFCGEVRQNWGFVTVFIHEENKKFDFSDIPYLIEDFDGFRAIDMENIYRRYAKIPWTILETQRLKLREITVKDVDFLYEIYKDPSISKFTNNLYEDKSEEIAYTKNYIEKVYPFYGFGMWVVIEKESGRVIGRAGFNFRDDYAGLELGYIIGEKFQNQGYATEICKAILEYALLELQVQEIRALSHPENLASIRVCEKIGMHPDGEVEIDGKMLKQFVY
jgi:RimJ/RimL family protein N-acetyltransferase